MNHNFAAAPSAAGDNAAHICRAFALDEWILGARQIEFMLNGGDWAAPPVMTLGVRARAAWVDGVPHCGACLREAEEARRLGLAALAKRFEQLSCLPTGGKNAVQRRGLVFETFICELLALFKLDPIVAYCLQTEQVDGGFILDADWLLEAKWWKKPVGFPEVAVFKDKLDRRPAGTRGVFISISGVARTVLARYREHGAAFVVVDGNDIQAVLSGSIDLPALLRAKWSRLVRTGEVFIAASQIVERCGLG